MSVGVNVSKIAEGCGRVGVMKTGVSVIIKDDVGVMVERFFTAPPTHTMSNPSR